MFRLQSVYNKLSFAVFANKLLSSTLCKLRIQLTVSLLFLSMIIASVMILDTICELILGMRDVIYMMMAVLIVNKYFMAGSFDWSIKMRETVSVLCQSTLDRYKSQYSQQWDKLLTKMVANYIYIQESIYPILYKKKKNGF